MTNISSSRPVRIFWAIYAVASLAVAIWMTVLSGSPIWFILALFGCALLGAVIWMVGRAIFPARRNF